MDRTGDATYRTAWNSQVPVVIVRDMVTRALVRFPDGREVTMPWDNLTLL